MAVLRDEAVHVVDHNIRTSTFYELYREGPKSKSCSSGATVTQKRNDFSCLILRRKIGFCEDAARLYVCQAVVLPKSCEQSTGVGLGHSYV